MLNTSWSRIVLILILILSAYAIMLKSPFRVLDDQVSIVNNALIHTSAHIKEIFTQGYFQDHSYYRPLINLSFMVEYQFFGLNSFFYNLDNVLLHMANTLLVWVLIAFLMESSWIGFGGALLFAIHPIHVEAVSNISGRAILMGAFFVLSSFISFLYFQKNKRIGFLVLSIMSFILGLLCKESTIVLPGVIFLYLWLKKKPMVALGPFVVSVGLYMAWRMHLGIIKTMAWRDSHEHVLGFVTFLRSLITDIRLMIFPSDLHFDRSQRLFLSGSDPEFLMTIAVVVIVFAFLWMNRQRMPLWLVFCLGWFALEMLPVSQIVTTIGVGPGVISCADHFLYLASIPIFIILVKIFEYGWRMNQEKQWIKIKIAQWILGAFLIFLFLVNVEQNIYASNELSLLKRSLEIQPHNARLHSSLGLLYASREQFEKAQEQFVLAVQEDFLNPRYRISLAQSICDQGRYQECLDLYNKIDDPGRYEDLLKKNIATATRQMNDHAQILSK